MIPRCTVGIVSLGTPHASSTSNEWDEAVMRITEAFGIDEELPLIQNLREGSSKLLDGTHQYLRYLSKNSIDLAQFYETQKTSHGPRIGRRWNEMVS